jgi:hypothetical protein
MQHWFVSTRNLSPTNRRSGQPWTVATTDVDAPGVRNNPFRRTVKHGVREQDRIWVWDTNAKRLSAVYWAVKRHSAEDGDGFVIHPFDPDRREPAVVWDVELVEDLKQKIDRFQLYDIYHRTDDGKNGYALFTSQGAVFNQQLYCYGPLTEAMVDELVRKTCLDVSAEEAIRGGGVTGTVRAVDPFDPADLEDGRRSIMKSILVRRGQQNFRQMLLDAYVGRCCISGCAITEILEAAHIVPYRGDTTNHVTNGLLLRVDLHTLFDLGLVGVDPDTHTVVVSRSLYNSEYIGFHGHPVAVPTDPAQHPSRLCLEHHRRTWR